MLGSTVEPEPCTARRRPALDRTPSTRVLVVEDEEVIRGLVRQMLVGEGYDVLVAEDGEEAIDARRQQPRRRAADGSDDAGIGGHELADRLRESQPGLKVIYMSGFAEGNTSRPSALPPATSFLGEAVHLHGADRTDA